ncbi:hypothetical protein SEA_DALANDE_4 [Gordonia phage DalanDe]|nr:hypothetical protein SEA_DALANDE_4 [Gordonia phage DalanDe]
MQGTPKPNKGTPETANKAVRRFFTRLRLLAKLIESTLAKMSADLLSAVAKAAQKHHEKSRDQIIANVLGTDSKKAAALAEELADDDADDDVFNMDADEYEQYLARREGKPPYPRGV